MRAKRVRSTLEYQRVRQILSPGTFLTVLETPVHDDETPVLAKKPRREAENPAKKDTVAKKNPVANKNKVANKNPVVNNPVAHNPVAETISVANNPTDNNRVVLTVGEEV